MSQVRTVRPDDPIDDEIRSSSIAPPSQYASSTTNFQTPAESSSLAPQEHPSTIHTATDISELGEENDTFPDGTPGRSATLKKKSSTRRGVSQASSKRSVRVQPVRRNENVAEDFYNVFNIPIPTSGNPTEALARRFEAWRKLLKDLVMYFQEIRVSYDVRAKATARMGNMVNTLPAPPEMLRQGGINDALVTLRNFHRIALAEANRAKEIEDDVIVQLNGLRSDLNGKIKEIKGLSGDFRNNVERERDNTRRMVESLTGAIRSTEHDPASASGKGDPFIIRLGVERQVDKQIQEENYLHKAYLNLENSGRELESIIVGEIQKAYNAYATILNKEVNAAHVVVDELRTGPIAMPRDHEWSAFVENSATFVNPGIPIREIQKIYYPGQSNPIAAEIRAGPLERKSKYLKSYTPGWYILSPTHLHEFKSADNIYAQQPVMSLYLLDQKLGSTSKQGASSNKFSLKGRQTGGMHRGHSWVFRAESFDTMLQWYNDIKALTEKTGEDKMAFVRRHARNVSGASKAISTVSGMEDDEADAVPFVAKMPTSDAKLQVPKRPEPGGRFPSDLSVNRSSSVQPNAVGILPVAPAGDLTKHPLQHETGPHSNATSNFQRPDEYPERYRDTASVYTGKRSRPTSSYYPDSSAVELGTQPQVPALQQQPSLQQKFQEDAIPYAANEARPRSTLMQQRDQSVEPVVMPRQTEDHIAQNDYAAKPQSRVASAQQSQAMDPRQELANYSNQSAELPVGNSPRGQAAFDNANDEDILAGTVGGAAIGAGALAGYSRFNRAQQDLAAHQKEPTDPYPSQADYVEDEYTPIPQQRSVEHEEAPIAPQDESFATVPEMSEHQTVPLETEYLAPAADNQLLSDQLQDHTDALATTGVAPVIDRKMELHSDQLPDHTGALASSAAPVIPASGEVFAQELKPTAGQAKEDPVELAPQTTQSSVPQYQYGDFRILGADAHHSMYAEQRAKQEQPPVVPQVEIPQATQGSSEPEMFYSDKLPDDTAAFAASRSLTVPGAGDESPSSDYGPGNDHRGPLEPATTEALPEPPSSHESVATSVAGTSQASSDFTEHTAEGETTPRPSSTANGKDLYTLHNTLSLTSPYPIIPGPAPYKHNPVLADPVLADQIADTAPGLSPTDKLLNEAAHTQGSGNFTAEVPVTSTLGSIFTKMERHGTSETISNLHVPGEFPKGATS